MTTGITSHEQSNAPERMFRGECSGLRLAVAEFGEREIKSAFVEVVEESKTFREYFLRKLHDEATPKVKPLVVAAGKAWAGYEKVLRGRIDSDEIFKYWLRAKFEVEYDSETVKALKDAGLADEDEAGTYLFDLQVLCEVTSLLYEKVILEMPLWADEFRNQFYPVGTMVQIVYEEARGEITKESAERRIREECCVIYGEYVLPYSSFFWVKVAAAVAES